jgi:shikimate dehydrogenase
MSERIPLAGVIGHPIAHSRSPRLHGHWLRRHGIAGHYVPMDIGRNHLEEVLRTLPKMGFRGVNVTIPYKEDALALADLVSDRAALIGAANTLSFREDGRIYADNTDGYGFIENLRQNALGWSAASGPAVVLGAGGAARAVVCALIDAGAPQIRLANRTRARADRIRADLGARVSVHDWSQAGHLLDDAATVVNTTSLGMEGQPELRLSLNELSKQAVVTDLVYAPLETQLLRNARERGNTVVDGLGMLLHQGIPGFERWFGARPEVDDDLRRAVLGE